LEVRPKSQKSEYFKNLPNIIGSTSQPPLSWLKSDAKKMKIDITSTPKREEAEVGINEQLIVEYYSR
jgi:small subunit ribosomal protein S4